MNTIVRARTSHGQNWARAFLGVVAIAVLAQAATTSAWAGKGNQGNPGVLPLQSQAFGKSYGEWLGEFFKWSMSLPVQNHPLLDTTGEFAGAGQQGPVWFLGAYAVSESVEHTVTIPPGKAIFLPIEYTMWATTPADLNPDGTTVLTDSEVFAILKEMEDAAIGLACEIDGRPIRNLSSYRCVSPAFSYTFPDLAMEDIWFNYQNPLPPEALVQCCGWVSNPSMLDGYALLLAPLSVGRHTIHLSGANPLWEYWYDVTFHITVE